MSNGQQNGVLFKDIVAFWRCPLTEVSLCVVKYIHTHTITVAVERVNFRGRRMYKVYIAIECILKYLLILMRGSINFLVIIFAYRMHA